MSRSLSDPPAELTDHLGYRLRQVSNHVSQAFARKLADQDVTVAEWVMMRALFGAAPTPPSQLAGRMGLTRGAVTKLADRLVDKGLVARAADPDDGRAQTLRLTPRGEAFTPELAALADRNEVECFGGLPPNDRQALDRILKDLKAHLGLTVSPID